MRVLLNVTSTQEYEVIMEDVDSIEQAKKRFDPCEDLGGLVPTGGTAYPTDGIEIKDCPDCGGRGRYYPATKNFYEDNRCKTCRGDGYLKVENKEENKWQKSQRTTS